MFISLVLAGFLFCLEVNHIKSHEQGKWGCNFLLVKYDDIMYGGRNGVSTTIVLICKICVDKMYTVSAQRKSNKAFFYCFIVFIEGTLRSVIFVWNETENRACFPLFSPHMQ